ncbi:MAG: hypothetical protein MI700_09350, partial [Balneolales bacterium]|nr:hypothetical protein [Balneolales bacterium]
MVWNILKNGWQQNRQSARRLAAQINYEQFEQAQNSKSNAYYAQFALLEYLFNKAGADVLRSRKEQIASKEPLFISLSNDGYLTSTQMLEYQSRADDIELQLRVLSESNDAFELIFEDELSTYLIPEFYQSTEIPEVDVQGIILAIDHSAAAQQQLHLQQQLIQKPSYWSHQVSLNASIYYNHQVSFSNERRDFTSVGVSLRVPLSTRHYSDKQAYIAANKELEEEQLLVTHNRKKEVLILHREYTLKQKQLN